jgi:hypothetical protein
MSVEASELEKALEYLIPYYDKYCQLTGKTPDYSKLPKYLIVNRKDLPALLKPKVPNV